MKKYPFLLGSILLITNVAANESTGSEMSHVVGGAVIAAGITAIVDTYYPEYTENRAMLGFGISSVAMIIEQSIEYALSGETKGEMLDAASHVAGAALGAYITDKYILSPIIKNSPNGEKTVGLQVTHKF